MRFPGPIAAAWLMLLCAVATGHAEKRVALVVGNGAYRHADNLVNPVNDARGMREALTKLGFDVVYGEELDQQNLRNKIGRFAEAVRDADVALVYFAGHGATFSDTPYVVPVDATFSSVERVPYELVAVETLIGELRRARGVRIAILDACRDNAAERELKRQAVAARGGGEVTRGLGPMKNPDGLILAYATQYLSTAADDVGASPVPGGLFSWMSSPTRHSPFTASLLNNIATPGLDVKDMFYKVGRDVLAATGGKQRPEISISMYDQYALAPRGGDGGVSSPATSPAADEGAWSILKDTRDPELLRRFIAQFPASPLRREAEERLKALEPANVAMLPVRPTEKPTAPADVLTGPARPKPHVEAPSALAPAAAADPPAAALVKPADGQQTAAVAAPGNIGAAGARKDDLQTAAPYAILIDVETGTVLYEKSADVPTPPSSMAELMTAEVVFNEITQGHVKKDDEFTVSEDAWRRGGAPSHTSSMFAPIRSRVRVEDLLRGAIVMSGNDACIALAEGIAGNEPAFATMMNNRARELRLANSYFTNATGLPDPAQKVTVRDLAQLARHIIRTYPDFYRIFGEHEFTWNKIRQQNRNPLLTMNIGADGMKTGFTNEGGYGLVGSTVQNGARLIVVVNGLKTAKERADEAKKIIEFGYHAVEARVRP